MKTKFRNQEQGLIGIIIVLVVVGLITGGLYYYLEKQIPEIPEITIKPAEEIVKPEEEVVTPPSEEELPKEEVVPKEIPPEEKIEEKPAEKPVVQKCINNICVSNKILLIIQEEGGSFVTYHNKWREITVDKEITKFYSQNVDKEADFLVVFTDLDTSPERPPYAISIKRNFSGIGFNRSPIDQSIVFGTKDLKLFAGMLNVVELSKPKNFESELITLAHEIGHLWLFYLDDPRLNLTERVGTEMRIHPWSCFQHGPEGYFDPMGGLNWKQLDKNTFVTPFLPSPKKTKDFRFSPLSLYLMGLIPQKSVPPMYWIDWINEDCALAGAAAIEMRIDDGIKREVTIEDIIRVYGKRIPDYRTSPKEFTIQFVLVVKENTGLVQEDINKFEEFINAFPDYFNYATFGKARVLVVPFK